MVPQFKKKGRGGLGGGYNTQIPLACYVILLYKVGTYIVF